jgi:beta-lactamase class C
MRLMNINKHNGRLSLRLCAKILFSFFAACLLPLAAFATPIKDLEPILAKLNADIQKLVQSKQIPGCAVAVVYRNNIVFMNTYGVRTIGKPEKIDANTLFQLGSVSKPIAATLASILEHKGLLKLDDPVTHYLPNFALNTNQASSTLRIKHILSHSTGVPRSGFNNLIEAHTPYGRILQTLQTTRVRTTIGKRYDYHNAMYSLISEITRSATRLPFKDALHANLLVPLNMTNTSATLSSLLKTPNRAAPHTRGNRGTLTPSDTYSRGYYAVAPAGGINSSIRDMSVFLKAQMGGYPEVLNHKMLTRLQTPQIVTPCTLGPNAGPPNLIKNAHYALGWRVVDFDHHKLVFHGGWVKGFTNMIAFMPDQQIGIVVLHNSENRFSAKTAVKFFESYLDIPRHPCNRLQTKTKLVYQKKKLVRRKTTTFIKCPKKITKKTPNKKGKAPVAKRA